MKNIIKYLIAAVLLTGMASCEKFLSELPTKDTSQPVENLDQLEGFLERAYFGDLENLAASTDDFGITKAAYDASPGMFTYDMLYNYAFYTDELANQVNDLMWDMAYERIFQMNIIIDNADAMEGDATRKQDLKSEAYFQRAYLYWMLANKYCLPYSERNLAEPGLPRRLTSDMEEATPRVTLRETYEQIEADIAEALKVSTDAPRKAWRSDKATVQAFLSRYYLHTGQYEKGAEAAEYALTNKGVVKLTDYNGIQMIPLIPGLLELPSTNMLSESGIISWEEFYFARFGRGYAIASDELLAMFDPAYDMRYQKAYIDWTFLMAMPAKAYMMFGMGSMYPSGLTIGEVMLNRAECLLRQPSPDIAGALALVNELRDKRYDPAYPDIHLPSGTRDEVLRQVLDERRRELPFTYRWWDIRRFSVNETAWDDVVVSHTFYKVNSGAVDKTATETYTLPVGSRRYAVPVNGIEVVSSHGQIQQNTY